MSERGATGQAEAGPVKPGHSNGNGNGSRSILGLISGVVARIDTHILAFVLLAGGSLAVFSHGASEERSLRHSEVRTLIAACLPSSRLPTSYSRMVPDPP